MPRRFHIITYGCQMNKLDSERIADALRRAGHMEAATPADADTVIINSCAVRRRAEQKVLSRATQFSPRAAKDPGFWLGVMGCFAERRGVLLFDDIPHLRMVVGPRRQDEWPRHLAEAEKGRVLAVGEPDGPDEPNGPSEPDGPSQSDGAAIPAVGVPRGRPARVQAFVAAMRGCDNHCAYCVVPQVRGAESSRPPREIVNEIRGIVQAGVREVTLLGQNIDAYGRGTDTDLASLLEMILTHVPESEGLLRLRFVTSHPRDITPRLAHAVRDLAPRVGQHFHMPAQSGSTRVLAAMGRGYTRAEYDGKLAMLRECAPEALVASDFIVGFPGETEGDFAATEDLLARAKFQNCFIFKYSPRPGTRAGDQLADDVPAAEKSRRNQRLLSLQQAVGEERSAALAGTVQTVLVEGVSPRDPARLIGRTSQNLIVVFPPPPAADATADATAAAAAAAAAAGKLARVRIVSGTALTLSGVIEP